MAQKESNEKPQRSQPQPRDLDMELVSILQRNDLYDDLYKVLTANPIGLRDLQEVKHKEIDEYCNESNFNSRQRKQFQRLMRIIHGQDSDGELQMQMTVIGDKCVGKTSLIQRYVLGKMMTSQYNHHRMNKTEKLSDDSLVNISILDGSAVTLRKEDYKKADCILICYDVTNDESFTNARVKWTQKIEEYGIQNDEVTVFLLGCKNELSKLDRAQTEARAQSLLRQGKLRLNYGECSAKNGDQVDKTFNAAAEMVYQQKLKHKSSLKSNALDITNSDDHKENEAATQKIKDISRRLKHSQNQYTANFKNVKSQLNTQTEQLNSALEQKDKMIKALQHAKTVIESKHDAICQSSKSKIDELLAKTKLLESKESEYHKEHAADTKQKDETIHDLRQENESAKSKIEDHKRDMDHKEKEHAEEIQNIKKALLDKKEQCERTHKQLLSAQTEAKQGKTENERLIQALNNNRNQHKSYETEMKTQMEQKDESIETLQKEKDSLEDEMVEFTLHKQQIAVIQKEKEDADAQIQSLQQRIDQLEHQQRQTQDKHVNDIHVRDEEIRRLVAESKTKPEDANTFQEQLQSAQRETQRLEAENKQYLEEKKALQTAIESLQSTLKSESATHATQLQNVSDAQLHTQIEFAQAKQYINSQDQDIQTSKKCSQNMQIMQVSFDEKKKKIKELDQTIATLNDQLLSAQRDAKQWKEASKLHNQEESRRFKQRKEDKERLQHQIRQKEERYTKDIQMKQDEIDTITTKRRAKESECAALRSSYDEESKSHEEEMNQLEEERKQTQDQHNKDIHAKEEEIRRLESELEAKQRDLYQKEKEHQMLLDASQAEVNTLKEQLQSAQRETLEKTECNAELQEKLHENEKVIESLKAANATQREEKENEYAMSLKQAHEEEMSGIKKENEDAITRIQEKENEIVSLQQQMSEERKQTHDQHNKDIHTKEEEIRRLASKLGRKEKNHQVILDAKQVEANTLKEQLQSAQRETLEKAELGTQYQNAMRRVEGINKEHNRTIRTLQEKLQSAQTETENEKVIESLKSEIATNATQREEKENEDAMSLKQAKDDGLNTQKELERVNTKYNELEKDQEALNTKHRQNQQRIEELMAKTKLLESKESEYHKEHEADTKQKDETIHDLRQENESSKSKIEDHKRDMDHKEKEHAEEIQNIKKALGKKDVDIESLRKQLLSSQTEAKQGKRENEQLIQALNNDRNQHKSYETKMKTQMEQKDESIQTLQKEKKSLEQRMEHKLDEALKGKGTRIASLKRLTKEMESLRQFISEN